ncbi:Osmotically-inducible protein OsmY, contains BON domain [Pseudomonas antarctica]|uniref:Osmotically-inducible protein OsmY, contains BON domain n=1 Tax=Pseudomonas antarctica TaxID=219572 RepID=A0A1H0D2Y3_9PSED|nr:BON domain-containing protein [Pseudomonas antarctica]KAF2406305.1 osmotically-inducible protein Y precursor [Pseudomonas antarctica]SDN64436.1 Osmotically-inducible protein OsmY, contains BON domain [Pseudomonas antarctica]
MNNQPNSLFLSTFLALSIAGASLSAYAAGDSQEVTNARQETQIWTTFALSPYLRSNKIDVTVENGKAILQGDVTEEVNKDLAKEIALSVKGITAVDNQIIVDANYVAPKPGTERGFSDVIEDASITAAVKSKLLWSKSAAGLSTNVDTKFARVILSGTAQSAAERELAGRLARNTHGVIAVDNQIKVNAMKPSMVESSKQVVDEAGSDISDSWITTKVKSTLLYTSNVAGSFIDVTTNKGVVSLSGKVNNGTEQALAIELAQNVRGVKSVQSNELIF